MSFNKPQMSNQVVGFGGSMMQVAADAARKRKRGGSSRPYWADAFKPNEMVADTIRLVPGDYTTLRVGDNDQLYEVHTEWWEYIEHYHGVLQRSGICSAGPHAYGKPSLRQPCHGCDIDRAAYEERKAAGKKGRGPISKSRKYAVNVIDMGVFHKVPQLDDKGYYKMNEKTGQPYLRWSKCKGVGCQECQISQENKRGRIQPWHMSRAHFLSLLGYARSIGTCCTTCLGRGVISTVSWHCGNPQCGAVVFDMATTTANLEQIMEIVNKPYHCMHCGTTMFPVERIRCVNCEARGTQPRRATIFDVDMQVRAVRTGDGEQTNLMVEATSDPKPIDQEFQELLQYAPDLSKLCSPTPLEEQARIWHRHAQPHMQQPPAQPQQYAQAYGQPPQGQQPQGYAPPPQGWPGQGQ